MIQIISDCVAENIRPNQDKIEFTATINGEHGQAFDPFVSGHLKWYLASELLAKKITFRGFRGHGGCWLVSEIISVEAVE